MTRLTASLLFLTLTAALAGQNLVITNANVIDGVSAQPLRNATVIVANGKIERIAANLPAPAGMQALDLKGRWLLPGFVDLHAHIADLRGARQALAWGTTTVRSLGVANFADLGLRKQHLAGALDLPEILASGYHVRPNPDERFFLDFPEFGDPSTKISGPDAVRRMTAAQIARGVQAIKTMGTERAGLPETDPRKRVYTYEELAAIVDEARKSGIFVASHAHGDEGAYDSVRAGVRSIEHGTYLTDRTLALMKEKGAYLVPTIATVIDLLEPGGDYDNPQLMIRGRAMLPRVRDTAARAYKMGVRVVAGTDTSYGPLSSRRMPHEIIELAAIGMSPMEAIKAATSAAAECAGIEKRTGSLRPGMEADMVVVDRDPLADLSSIQDVLIVISNGKLVVNRGVL